jgi:hypothetical protein
MQRGFAEGVTGSRLPLQLLTAGETLSGFHPLPRCAIRNKRGLPSKRFAEAWLTFEKTPEHPITRLE